MPRRRSATRSRPAPPATPSRFTKPDTRLESNKEETEEEKEEEKAPRYTGASPFTSHLK